MEKEQILKQVFGYDSFRGCQGDIIDAILQGQDVLAIMPTGAGKSLCYQVPALMLDGITLVISPLKALMKDQVDHLQQRGVPAIFINSALKKREKDELLAQIAAGARQVIYITPEGLQNERYFSALAGQKIALVAVDEAHCVSQWGYNFRPNFLRIPEFIARLPERPVIAAFTATATESVAENISEILSLQEPRRFITGYSRENLFLRVLRDEEDEPLDKDSWILDYVRNHGADSGIVYCATVAETDRICSLLLCGGVSAGRYYGNAPDEEKNETQQRFMDGSLKVIVATNAFGMGIDKADIRYVIHQAMPGCIESYYQEAGRAGRDGKLSECTLLFSNRDIVTQQSFIKNKTYATDDDGKKVQLLDMDHTRLNAMIDYCRTDKCLNAAIETYFGVDNPKPCGHCCRCCNKAEILEHSSAPVAAVPVSSVRMKKKTDPEKELLSRLKECRRGIARENRLKSDFIRDKVLEAMVKEKPQTAQDLQSCGMSADQAARWGELFLDILKK